MTTTTPETDAADADVNEPRQRPNLRRAVQPHIDRVTSFARTWWAFTEQPPTFADTWEQSKVDIRRVPDRDARLYTAWVWANRTERILFCALLLLAPTFLQGPLRWVAPRITRRISTYLLILLVITGTVAGV